MMWGYGYGPMTGYGWTGELLSVIWAIIIIAIVLGLVRWAFGWRRWRHGRCCRRFGWDDGADHSAIDIVRERYAKGEIDKEEYEEKKKMLQD